MEGLEGDEMKRQPTKPGSSLFTPIMIRRLIVMGGTASVLGLGFFWWRTSTVPFAQAQTETFTLVAICQWFNVMNCRSETASALNLAAFTNKWLAGGLVLGVILQFLENIHAGPREKLPHRANRAGEPLDCHAGCERRALGGGDSEASCAAECAWGCLNGRDWGDWRLGMRATVT